MQAAVGKEQVATWEQGFVAGSMTPAHLTSDGRSAEVQVLGIWRSYATLSSLEVTSGIVELLVGQHWSVSSPPGGRGRRM
jgi:hypothetical protein